jgi:hypothetical protein
LLRGRFGRMQGRLAPSTSSDGHVVLFGLNLDFDVGEFYTLQAATTVPDPIPWATVIGQPYRLSTSPNAPDLGGTSLSFQYMGVEVPPEEEKWLRVYYWNGGAWEKLDTHLDLYHNFASARTQGPGVYALMSSIEVKRLEPPWDQFGYVVQESRPVTEALVSISGYYTTVVHYDASDPGDPWKIFDITAPDYVNDLRELEFGESHWIRVSESITLYLKGSTTGNQGISSATPQQATFDWEGAFPPLPATYYGALVPHPAFTPTVGMTITAMVNGNVCGETKTIAFEDEIVYAINVWPDGLTNGCGAPGRSVLFITEPYYLAPSPPWDNDRVQETPLHPLTHTFYLPMMTQSSESDQPWTGP